MVQACHRPALRLGINTTSVSGAALLERLLAVRLPVLSYEYCVVNKFQVVIKVLSLDFSDLNS